MLALKLLVPVVVTCTVGTMTLGIISLSSSVLTNTPANCTYTYQFIVGKKEPLTSMNKVCK